MNTQEGYHYTGTVNIWAENGIVNSGIAQAWQELQDTPSYFERYVPNEETRIELRFIHWQEQALTQNSEPFDYSLHNAGYEGTEPDYNPN